MIGNVRGIRAIYMFEMARFGRTVWTSLMLPVITTTLYFVVFGSAIARCTGKALAPAPSRRANGWP